MMTWDGISLVKLVLGDDAARGLRIVREGR